MLWIQTPKFSDKHHHWEAALGECNSKPRSNITPKAVFDYELSHGTCAKHLLLCLE